MQPDVVVSHELGARSFCAARYCKRSGAKLVLATFMSEHTEQGRGGLRHRLRRYLINQADALTYNGPSCRRYLLSLGAREEQLFHWPYAADDRHFQGAGFQQTASVPALPPRNRLLCIGQLTQRKGVMPMLRQINRFIQSTGRAIELTLVGNGPLRDELNNLSQHESTRSFPQSLDANFRLNVLGNRPAESLPALMRQHGALIAPTLADEWLLVVNEAMHIGLPVIGSVYAQAVTTLIDHGRNGWQYDPLIDSEVNAKVAGAPPLDRVLREFLELDDLGYGDLQAEARTTVAHLTPHYSAAGIGAAIAATLQTRLRSDR